MSIYLTGSSGFIGKSLISKIGNEMHIQKHIRGSELTIVEENVIHLAGLAYDLKKISNPQVYYDVNFKFTQNVFDAFLNSNSKKFIFLSSVKAVADKIDEVLTESHKPNPITHYGKSKLMAEEYILNSYLPKGKSVYILRPCMVHGPGNKGNLNLLFNFVLKGIPWPLGAFKNSRSICSIDNLLFVLEKLIDRDDIPSGIYNIADDVPISTNTIITLIAQSKKKKPRIWYIPQKLFFYISKIGDKTNFILNTERLKKLTESFVVSNSKIKSVIGESLPVSSKDGLLKTFKSFD